MALTIAKNVLNVSLSKYKGYYLHTFSPPSPDKEYVLCEIVLQAPGVLSMNPDFNFGRQPYIVETTSESNDCGGGNY